MNVSSDVSTRGQRTSLRHSFLLFMNKFCYRIFVIVQFFLFCTSAHAQISGIVSDSQTKEPLPFVNVYYQGKSSIGTTTDINGRYSIAAHSGRKLMFSYVGYKPKTVMISSSSSKKLFVKLDPDSKSMQELVIQAKSKKKYTRKNNPAVDMMRRVVAAKSRSDLSKDSFYQYNKYEKITASLNEVNDTVFDEPSFKNFQFLKNHVETCPETGKLILPLTVDETVSEKIYRREPHSEKTIIRGQNSQGINELFNTGDILNTVLKDCFTDVDIYKDEVRMLQYPFLSPIAEKAISFYRFYIADTVMVDKDKCFHLSFVPNNQQDFGFSGEIYIMADSSWQVRKVELSIPRRSDVNFVEDLQVRQEFQQLPNGQRVQTSDDMLVQLKMAKFLHKFQVQRTTRYTDYAFEQVSDKLFKKKGSEIREANAMMRDEDFWKQYRPVELSSSESSMDAFVRNIEQIKGFKYFIFMAKALIENFVEVTVHGKSIVDIGPVNTMISQNFIDGLRLRASGQTTANLNKHFFLRGYGAYGFRDHRWKGNGEATYSFNAKDYLPREFPVNNLSLSYYNDVMSPSDKFLPTDKDNVFTSFKFTEVDQMMYVENWRLKYEREWENGFRVTTQIKRENDEPCGKLFYQPLSTGLAPSTDASLYTKSITNSDIFLGFYFQPGATYINTKQRRLTINLDAPIFTLNHTCGIKGIWGSNYNYNYTEAGLYKRFWLGSWGKIDSYLKGGIQWNQVPYPLLIMPEANLSYIMEDYTFNLVNNMEFLNDRFASWMVSWDMNGKIFNRIPLIRRLKWREYFGCNVLWGTLSERNNPFLAQNAGSDRLFYFPGHFDEAGNFHYSSHIMDKNKPYVEVIVGIHNIFKLLHIEYVRRLTYIDGSEYNGVHKWGIRFMARVTF
jgi:hypothetical protein